MENGDHKRNSSLYACSPLFLLLRCHRHGNDKQQLLQLWLRSKIALSREMTPLWQQQQQQQQLLQSAITLMIACVQYEFVVVVSNQHTLSTSQCFCQLLNCTGKRRPSHQHMLTPCKNHGIRCCLFFKLKACVYIA